MLFKKKKISSRKYYKFKNWTLKAEIYSNYDNCVYEIYIYDINIKLSNIKVYLPFTYFRNKNWKLFPLTVFLIDNILSFLCKFYIIPPLNNPFKYRCRFLKYQHIYFTYLKLKAIPIGGVTGKKINYLFHRLPHKKHYR